MKLNIEHNKDHPLIGRVEKIMEEYDRVRFYSEGGYPSDWIILGDSMIIATVVGSDWNEPELIIGDVEEFVKEQEETLRELYDP